MEVPATSYQEFIKLQPSITASNKSSIGQCMGIVYGNMIPYFTASNSVVLSDAYLCTTNTPMLQAMSSAFSNALTFHAFMNAVGYFANNWQGGVVNTVLHFLLKLF